MVITLKNQVTILGTINEALKSYEALKKQHKKVIIKEMPSNPYIKMGMYIFEF